MRPYCYLLAFSLACQTASVLPPDNNIPPLPTPEDMPHFTSINLTGAFVGWDTSAVGTALSYQGEGLWEGEVTLPIGFQELKFVAENDWANNWGGGQDDLAPPELGMGVQDGDNILLALPLSGRYHVSLDEATGAWSIGFAEDFAANLSQPGKDIVALMTALETASSTEAANLEANFVASHEQAELPVVQGEEALFFTMEESLQGFSIAGTFNDWTANEEFLIPLTSMLAYKGLAFGPAVRHSYKLTDGTTWLKDPQNVEIEWDGIETGTIGDFNSVVYTEGAPYTERLRWLSKVESIHLGNSRDVYVLLPPSYTQNLSTRYPSLYIHDGNESIVRGQMDQVIYQAMLSGEIPEMIVVFIALHDQNERLDEYTFTTPGSRGHLYRRFVADELVGKIDGQFRTIASPEARGILGASLGGLISFYIGYHRDDVFRVVGGQSSSFFWNDNEMITTVQNGTKKPLRVYLDSGCPNDNCDVTREMSQVLHNRGYDMLHVEEAGAAHDWFFWQERLVPAIQFLFPPASF